MQKLADQTRTIKIYDLQKTIVKKKRMNRRRRVTSEKPELMTVMCQQRQPGEVGDN